ncbi:F-box protein [Dorcoceras hygrometricum]|uniref:F-box protein n=1 Tax=Dorcoceras hygrometricum TaxID=472368 RepID=A0A2Z7B7A9_9LAMI|nr:F-box protein [Dorcoceras hygrometricum]
MKRTEPVPGLFFQDIFQELYRWSNKDIESISYIPVELESVLKVSDNILNFLTENVVSLPSNNTLLPLNKPLPVKWPSLPRSSSISLAFDPLLESIDASTDFKIFVKRILHWLTGGDQILMFSRGSLHISWDLKCFTSLEELEKENSKDLYDIPKKMGSRPIIAPYCMRLVPLGEICQSLVLASFCKC